MAFSGSRQLEGVSWRYWEPYCVSLVWNTPPSNILSLVIGDDKFTLVLLNVVLLIGLVAKAIGRRGRRQVRVTASMEQRNSSERDLSLERQISHERFSCAFSLGGVEHWVLDHLPTVRVRLVLEKRSVGKRPICWYSYWLRYFTEFLP